MNSLWVQFRILLYAVNNFIESVSLGHRVSQTVTVQCRWLWRVKP